MAGVWQSFVYRLLINVSLEILTISVDWSGRRRLQREQRVQVRPRRSLRRGGSRTARGKRPPAAEINLLRR